MSLNIFSAMPTILFSWTQGMVKFFDDSMSRFYPLVFCAVIYRCDQWICRWSQW
ncbi:MAG: hypothetical protein HRU25_13800 [Psychrobium sp.]|nr:hypothetical protein [Psychrobium sp.]